MQKVARNTRQRMSSCCPIRPSLPERAEAERNARIDPLVQSELETSAGCFRNAVRVLQAEPEPGERLHTFLRKAATKNGAESGHHRGTTNHPAETDTFNVVRHEPSG